MNNIFTFRSKKQIEESKTKTEQKNTDGEWVEVLPEPYHYGLFVFIYKRMTGWRDQYNRKAHYIRFNY